MKCIDLIIVNGILRYVLQTYLRLYLSSAFVIKQSMEQRHLESTYTNLTAFLTMAALLFFAFYQLAFTVKNRDKLNLKSFKSKYESLYKDVDVESPGYQKIFFTLFFCLRRVCLVITIILIF